MFDSLLTLSTIEAWKIIVLLLVSLGLGFVFALVFSFLKRQQGFSKEYTITLVIYLFVATALMLVAFYLTSAINSTETETRIMRAGVALAGIFTMTRWRSSQRTAEELTYLFFMTAVGTGLGLGYIGYACVLETMLIVVLVILKIINFPFISKNCYRLKVVIPEDMDYEHCFDEVFARFTKNCSLSKVKSSDLGTLYTLVYEVELKNGVSQKEFIDELRALNGNLNVMMNTKQYETKID